MFYGIKSRVSFLVKWPLRNSIAVLLNSRSVVAHRAVSLYPPGRLYVRQDGVSSTINVFDGDGNKLWTIESLGGFSNEWIVYTVTREQVAKIHMGAFTRKVEFFTANSIKCARFYRDLHCFGMFNCKFNLNDGTTFVWTNLSRSLEQVTYTSDNNETRKRIARVKLLRKWQFDWEISYDISLEPVVILATAFMPMYSQWDLSTSSAIYAPEMHSKLGGEGYMGGGYSGGLKHQAHVDYESYGTHLIYEPDGTDLSFFNPPVGYEFA